MGRNSREQLLIALTLVSVLAFGGTWARNEIGSRFDDMENEIATMERSLAQNKQLAEERKYKEEKYQQVMREVNLGRDKMVVVQDQLNDLIRQSQVKTGGVKPIQSSTKGDEEFEAITLQIANLEATVDQFLRFLYLLDNSSTVMEVNKMTLKVSEDPREYHSPVRVDSMEITRLAKLEGSSADRGSRP